MVAMGKFNKVALGKFNKVAMGKLNWTESVVAGSQQLSRQALGLQPTEA